MITIMQTSISLLFKDARDTGLAPGETLFAAGEDVADFFMVRSGRVHLQRHTTHGAQMVLQNAGPGGVVAESSAYSSRYHCDAIAAEESVVAGLPKQRFLSALADDPALATGWSALLARSVQAARLRSVRAHVEHVFARQKGPMALVIRSIGLARATVKIGLANLVCNMRRMVWLAAT
jgi:CRP-like cAMP-binding protein